jgi:hypothetical protein
MAVTHLGRQFGKLDVLEVPTPPDVDASAGDDAAVGNTCPAAVRRLMSGIDLPFVKQMNPECLVHDSEGDHRASGGRRRSISAARKAMHEKIAAAGIRRTLVSVSAVGVPHQRPIDLSDLSGVMRLSAQAAVEWPHRMTRFWLFSLSQPPRYTGGYGTPTLSQCRRGYDHESRKKQSARMPRSRRRRVRLLDARATLCWRPPSGSEILPTKFGKAVDRDVTAVRAATESFKLLDNAVAAGYDAHVMQCVQNPPEGGMGFHHAKAALRDSNLEVEKPEILTYARRPDGQYKLTGVEYVVPIAAWSRHEPPSIMGQNLKRAESLGIWYLHVWIWEPNPSGLFADWNPRVKC